MVGPTLVIGLGNPILGDDGVGWRVADEVERRLRAGPAPPPATVERLAVGGLALMERLVGCEGAIIVDSCLTDGEPGAVRACSLAALAGRPVGHLDSTHDASFAGAMATGRALGAQLPDDVVVVTVDTHRCDVFDDALTAPVESAVDRAADEVMALIARAP
jgi:hydrogenase maturation protease